MDFVGFARTTAPPGPSAQLPKRLSCESLYGVDTTLPVKATARYYPPGEGYSNRRFFCERKKLVTRSNMLDKGKQIASMGLLLWELAILLQKTSRGLKVPGGRHSQQGREGFDPSPFQ